MLGKNYSYRGYSLSDDIGWIKRTALQNVAKNKAIRGNTYAYANTHGSTIGPRIAESRLFSFEGQIHEIDTSNRERRRADLCEVFHIESNFSNQLFYPLTRETKYGESRTANCIVYTPLQATNEICNPVIDFTFELVSADPRVYSTNVVEVNGGLGQMGAGPLRNILPFEVEDMFSGGLECFHDGDWDAPLSLEIMGNLVNPKVFVIQDNEIKYFLKINKNTTDLFISNINTTAESSSDRFVITDAGVRIDEYIAETQGGGPLFIPASQEVFGGTKVSYVVVMADNYMEAVDTATVKVSYRHTYSY